jgi:hypothetical protein
VDSMARLDEAAYCTKYLYQTRATLVKALAEPEKK